MRLRCLLSLICCILFQFSTPNNKAILNLTMNGRIESQCVCECARVRESVIVCVEVRVRVLVCCESKQKQKERCKFVSEELV